MKNHSTATAQIIPFQFEAREVRTLLIDDQPWFCAADVCAVLDYTNGRQAIQKNCREKGVSVRDTPTNGGVQAMTFIDEGNLYRLIIKSRKEEARRFESWVCDEVLPAIRKHGRYLDEAGKLDTLLSSTIGADGFRCLSTVVDGKVSFLPAPVRRKARAKLWSQLRAAFGVRRSEDIPADQLDAARNFVAAYAVEGEWLSKEECRSGAFVLDEFQAQDLNDLLHYTDWVNFRWRQGISDAVKALNPRFHSQTWEFFQEAKCAADRLERGLPDLVGFFRSREGHGLRPHECIAKGYSAGNPAGC